MSTTGINLGDVTLHFRGDATDLNSTLAQVDRNVPAALRSSGAAAEGAGDAVKKIIPSLQNFGTEGANAARTVGREFHEAYGTIALTGELTGITLPRHVRSLLASLPGISTALAAAFSGVALVFIIEALVKAAEAVKKYSESASEAGKAWKLVGDTGRDAMNEVGDEILKTQAKLDDFRGAHLEALRKELLVIDHITLKDLQKEFDDLAKGAGAALDKMQRYSWIDFLTKGTSPVATGKVHEELNQFIKQFDDLARAQNKPAALELLVNTILSVQDRLQKLRDEAAKSRPGTNAAEIDAAQRFLTLLEQMNAEQGQANTLADNKAKIAKNDTTAKILADQAKALREFVALLKGVDDEWARVDTARKARNKDLETQSADLAKINEFRIKEQLKAEEDLTQGTLRQLRAREQAGIAALDGQTEALRGDFEQQARLYKGAFDIGAMSAQDYLAKVKQLYSDEVAALQAQLAEKEQLVILEAQNEAAMRGEILSDAGAKELSTYIELETQKAAVQQEFANRYLEVEDRVTRRIAQNFNSIGGLLDAYSKKLRQNNVELTGWGKFADAVIGDVSTAFGGAIAQWAAGQASFGEALRQSFQQYLAQLAGKAAVDALYFTAWGIADVFWNPARAAADFAAAAEFGAIAAVAGGIAKSLGGSSKSAATGAVGSASTFVSTQQPEQQPVEERNTLSFANGGLFNRRTMVMLGDSTSGGDASEAAIPLTDERALAAIGEALGPYVARQGTTVHVHVDGMISPDNLQKVIAKINREINAGTVRLNASNSTRFTRRS